MLNAKNTLKCWRTFNRGSPVSINLKTCYKRVFTKKGSELDENRLMCSSHGGSCFTLDFIVLKIECYYTLSEAWSGVNWADLMAAQGDYGTDFYDRSTRTIVGTMLWTEYNRPVIKIGPKDALGSHEIRPIHSAPSLGQSLLRNIV